MLATKIVRLFGISALTIALIPPVIGATPVVPVIGGTTIAAVTSSQGTSQSVGTSGTTGTVTTDAKWLADWIARTHDNGSAGFVIVDKRAAQLHVFNAEAKWLASSAVLLGAALGDDSVPGIGTRPMASIQVQERTTPAGRFVGERGQNTSGDDVVWVDYDAAVSMHRVRLNNPNEHRAERLASATASDNRISYGCINVPVAFFERHIQPLFAQHQAIIYVLPDTKSAQEVFGPSAVASH